MGPNIYLGHTLKSKITFITLDNKIKSSGLYFKKTYSTNKEKFARFQMEKKKKKHVWIWTLVEHLFSDSTWFDFLF